MLSSRIMPEHFRFIDPDLGPEEIEAVSALLSDPEAQPYINFVPRPGGVIQKFVQDFTAFLLEGFDEGHPLVKGVMSTRGGEGLQVFASAFSCATGALYAGLRSTDVAAGEVVTTSLNYVGVPSAIVRAGASPKFVDVEAGSLCMDVAGLEKAIGRKTRAVLLTHVNRFVDIEPIADLFRRKGYEFPLIQDASLAVGSTLGGLRPGVVNLGPGGFTVFSFATSKVITGLGGGMLVTNDGGLLARSLGMAYQGMNLERIQKLDAFGANLKMNDINAAIALCRLARRKEIFERRRALKRKYDELLAPLVEKGLVRLQDAGDEAVLTHYAAIIDGRDELAERMLGKHGVHLAMWHVHHLQDLYGKYRAKLPASEGLDGSFTFLPFHTRLTDDDVGEVCRALAEELTA